MSDSQAIRQGYENVRRSGGVADISKGEQGDLQDPYKKRVRQAVFHHSLSSLSSLSKPEGPKVRVMMRSYF